MSVRISDRIVCSDIVISGWFYESGRSDEQLSEDFREWSWTNGKGARRGDVGKFGVRHWKAQNLLSPNPSNHIPPQPSRGHLKCEPRALPDSGPQQASCKLPALIKELPAPILYRHKWKGRIYSLPGPNFRFRR
ncbi:uncharacterized protein NPIL_381131 [Nephila pilipes]|uniref:Uncharacterized protein n=1 Tax=Nephila pilipes TaxID=299642 RepID=A0A8X6QEC3_NEPPI|nr:uncharacterized protein NPIL_381131 [Nephila pilipes]